MKQETKVMLDEIANGMTRIATLVRQDTVEALASKDHVEAIMHYVHVRAATETIKQARKALDEIEDSLSKQGVPDIMRAQGIKNIKLEGVGTVGISNKVTCSMKDKDAGFAWLRRNQMGDLITETVNSSTLAAHAKSMIEEGMELPEDIFTVNVMTYTSIRK